MKGMWELRGGVTKGVGVEVRGKDERGGKGSRREEGLVTGKGRGSRSCVAVGPGRTQAGPSSGEDGTLPGPRPGHSIDIPTTGFPVMYG